MGRRIPFADSGNHFKTVLLTEEEVKALVEKYPFVSTPFLMDEYGVSKSLINDIARHYSLKKNNETRGWKTNDEPVDLVMFDWFYPKTTLEQMREVFGKSEHYIAKLGKERELSRYNDVVSARQSKNKPRIKYSISKNHFEGDDINLEGVLYIVSNYATETVTYLVNKIGCKESTVNCIARYYELVKDQESVKKGTRRY